VEYITKEEHEIVVEKYVEREKELVTEMERITFQVGEFGCMCVGVHVCAYMYVYECMYACVGVLHVTCSVCQRHGAFAFPSPECSPSQLEPVVLWCSIFCSYVRRRRS
jgi:hypothetical protein